MTEQEILKKIANKVYHPVYFLMGEEPYYIDLICDYIEANVLTDSEKEFNLSVFYGKDIDAPGIISEAKRFPMMSNYQVVIIKEAQTIKKIEELQSYITNPVKSTILVICYKYGKIDKRKVFAKTIDKVGVMYESKKIYEDKVPAWITEYLRKRQVAIQPKAAHLLAESLGADLSKVVNELGKLLINVEKGSEITADLVAKNIGISKDFNVFELINCLLYKDVTKAGQIVIYYGQNSKEYPCARILPLLYTSFQKVLLYHQIQDKSMNNVAAILSIQPYFVKDYVKGASLYSRAKVEQIIGFLHEYDVKAKGVDSTADGGELLKELVFKILH